jgi:hypothetical protein
MAAGSGIDDAHDRFRRELDGVVADDGGMSWVAGGANEPEPTALAALALDDDASRAWLAAHQADDGSVVLETGEVRNTGGSGLIALAMAPGAAQDRALDFAIGAKGGKVEDPLYAEDPLGWGWVPGTFSWVEPTARVLLATRILRASDTTTIDDGVRILSTRETDAGGWNYGNANVNGTDLTPYVQTTAIAVIALAGLDVPALGRGIDRLRQAALVERGGMSLATTLLAVRLAADDPDFEAELVAALVAQYDRTAFLRNFGALAWAVLATAPGPSPLAVPS